MKTVSLKISLLFLLVALAALAQAQPPEIILPADAPSQRTVQLEEQWRVGGEDDEDVLLGLVSSGVMDEAGNTYLLDSQLSQVLVIDAEGRMTGTLSREGEGPGELSRPTRIFMNNPNQIGVAQAFPGKLILLNLDDTPGGSIVPESNPEAGGFAFVGEAVKRNGHLVVNHGFGSFDMNTGKMVSTSLLTEVDADGKKLGKFAEHVQERELSKQVFDEAANYSELVTWALGPQYVYTVPFRDRYLINVKNMDGSLAKVISRPFEPRKRDPEDKKDMVSGFNIVVAGKELEIESHILDTDPALSRMYVGDSGKLFVENCFQSVSRLSPGVAGRFDVISKDGVLIEELTFELDGFNPEQDRLSFLDESHFLWIRNFQAAAKSFTSGMMGTTPPKEEDIADAEPLEVVFCRISE